MRLTTALKGNLRTELAALGREVRDAANHAVKDQTDALKGDIRRKVVRAKLGNKLAKTWRSKFYNDTPAGFIWSKAPALMNSFIDGAVIRAKNGRYLAIPTDFAPKRGSDRKKITPKNWPSNRFGPLVFVAGKGGRPAMLVSTVVVSDKTGKARKARTLKSGNLSGGAQSVPMFWLVPQVKIKKRFSIERSVTRRRDKVWEQMVKELGSDR